MPKKTKGQKAMRTERTKGSPKSGVGKRASAQNKRKMKKGY